MDKPSDRLFLDTGYVLARFNRRDQYHGKAKQLADTVAASRELWTTDAVLFEVAAAFSHPDNRPIFISIWDEFHGGDSRCRVFESVGTQLDRAVELFRQRADKSWSLTDCLSFVAMQDEQLVDALSSDRHFIQAGFRALLVQG
jgi:predicted nucleic acid-binding protein